MKGAICARDWVLLKAPPDSLISLSEKALSHFSSRHISIASGLEKEAVSGYVDQYLGKSDVLES